MSCGQHFVSTFSTFVMVLRFINMKSRRHFAACVYNIKYHNKTHFSEQWARLGCGLTSWFQTHIQKPAFSHSKNVGNF